jgi:hypothetical protein
MVLDGRSKESTMPNVTFQIPVRKTGRLWPVSVELPEGVSAIAAHFIYHGIKQKLGDAASGASPGEESIAAVEKRLLTLFNIPGDGSPRSALPKLDAAMISVVKDYARSKGRKAKEMVDVTTLVDAIDYLSTIIDGDLEKAVAAVRAKAEAILAIKAEVLTLD